MSLTAPLEQDLTWSRIEDGFFVASRAGDFLGFADRVGEGFLVSDGLADPIGRAADLDEATELVLRRVGDRGQAATVVAGPLVSLVYTSFATTRFDDDSLSRLLEESRAHNALRDVTGMLLYREGRFLQTLEGPADVVRDLVETLRADRRHHGVRVILEEPIDERRFAEWTMGFRPWVRPASDLPVGFRDAFDDLEEDADGADGERAVRELMQWFRYRADAAADAGD